MHAVKYFMDGALTGRLKIEPFRFTVQKHPYTDLIKTALSTVIISKPETANILIFHALNSFNWG